MLHALVRPALVLALLALPAAHAFEWAPFEFDGGDQRYTMEIVQGEGAEAPTATVDVDVADRGETFDVSTTMTFQQTGVGADELDEAIFGGGAIGMFSMGPMLMFGPAFMVLPMLLEDTDIHVRSEPIEVMGVGQLHMDREEEVAGHACVVMRLEPANENGLAMEFALAEDLPLPCYSRYGEGEGRIEVRLVRAD